MFQLLQPIWLWGISGIIIPVMIHLWNIREGKTIKVGSISLLQESARQQARSLRLKDLLLLLLRSLLIVVLAWLLAKPAWQKQLFSKKEKGWIVIEKESIKDAYGQHKRLIDSLLNAGFGFHYFAEGFATDDWQTVSRQEPDTTRKAIGSYWTLLKELNEMVPSDLPVFLFTTNGLKRFSGTRPNIAMNLKWLTYSLPDTLVTKPVTIHKTPTDSLKMIVANSKFNATYFTAEKVDEKSITTDMELDTSAINIAIYADNYAADASYLKAAIDAIAQTAGRKMNTFFLKNEKELTKEMDWLFWLSEKLLPQAVPPNVFFYEKGKGQPVTSFIYSSKLNSINDEPVHLTHTVSATSSPERRTIWKDGYGNSLLAVSNGEGNRYHFYSRFNPAWNDLPWSSSFVNMIYDLLVERQKANEDIDGRIIDADQMQPQFQRTKDFDKQNFIKTIDLTKWFWVLAFLLFFLERYISLTRKSGMYA